MNLIFSNPNDRMPYIAFENENSLELFGNFIPKNPEEFYRDLHKWIDENGIKYPKITSIDIGIHYTREKGMNYIEKIIRKLILDEDTLQPIKIVWFYSPRSISVNAGKHLSKKLNHPFEFVPVWKMLETLSNSNKRHCWFHLL